MNKNFKYSLASRILLSISFIIGLVAFILIIVNSVTGYLASTGLNLNVCISMCVYLVCLLLFIFFKPKIPNVLQEVIFAGLVASILVALSYYVVSRVGVIGEAYFMVLEITEDCRNCANLAFVNCGLLAISLAFLIAACFLTDKKKPVEAIA